MIEQTHTISTINEVQETETSPRQDRATQQEIVGTTVVNLAFDKDSRLVYEIDQETGELSPTTLLPPSMREETVLANQQDLLALSYMGDSDVLLKDLNVMTGKTNIGKTLYKFPDLFEKTTGDSPTRFRTIQEYTVSSVIPEMMDPEFVESSKKAAKIDYHINKRINRTESLFEQAGPAALVKCGARTYLMPLFTAENTGEGDQTVPNVDTILYLNLLRVAKNSVELGNFNIELSDLARATFSNLSEEEMWTLPSEEIPSYQGRTNGSLNEHVEEIIRLFNNSGVHYSRAKVAKQLFTLVGNNANRQVKIAAELDDVRIIFDPNEFDLEKEGIQVTGEHVGHSSYHLPVELPDTVALREMDVKDLNGLYVGLFKQRAGDLSRLGYSPQTVGVALKSIRDEMKQRGIRPEVLGFGNILKTKRPGGVRRSSGYVSPGNTNKRV